MTFICLDKPIAIGVSYELVVWLSSSFFCLANVTSCITYSASGTHLYLHTHPTFYLTFRLLPHHTIWVIKPSNRRTMAQPPPAYDFISKIVSLGDSGSGKSSVGPIPAPMPQHFADLKIS